MSYTVKCAIEITDPLVIFLMKYFHGHSRPSPDLLFNASCFFCFVLFFVFSSESGGISVLSSLFNTIRKTIYFQMILQLGISMLVD